MWSFRDLTERLAAQVDESLVEVAAPLAEDPADFAALRAYSPVHNVRSGACYPATLVTTAERDDRVVPWHSYKFAAELQRSQACDRPVLLLRRWA